MAFSLKIFTTREPPLAGATPPSASAFASTDASCYSLFYDLIDWSYRPDVVVSGINHL